MTALLENDDIDLIETYLGHLWDSPVNTTPYIAGTAKEIFQLYGGEPLPVTLEKLIDRIVIESYIYNVCETPHKKLLACLEYIHNLTKSIKGTNQNPGYSLPDGTYSVQYAVGPHLLAYFDSAPETLTDGKTHALYHVLTLIQLNFLIGYLQENSTKTLDINYALQLQQTFERAKALKTTEALSLKLSEYIHPDEVEELIKESKIKDKKKQASKGGKAKAEQQFGETKQYVRDEIDRIANNLKKSNQKIHASKIADKIHHTLQTGEYNFEYPEHSTLYNWVRKHLKGKDF